jgi:hypothetical protein
MAIDLSRLPKHIQHDKLLLEPNTMFRCSPEVQEAAVTQDPQRYYQLDKPTLAAGLIAVRNDPDIFQKFLGDFPDCDENIQLDAVKARPWNIEFINNPCQKAITLFLEMMGGETFSDDPDNRISVILKALEADGAAIRFIEKPTREMKLAAISDTPDSIRWMTDLDEEMQLAAAISPEAVRIMIDTLKLHFSPKVKRLAKQSLLSKIQSASHEIMAKDYRRALVRISSNAELLEMLRDPLHSPQPQALDFAIQPSDEISKLLMLRQGFKTYFLQAQPGWTMSDELQVWVAPQQLHGEYGYNYLPSPCSQAKLAFVRAVAGPESSSTLRSAEQIRQDAIDRCPLGYIHKVFECIPSPSDSEKIGYIERVAGATRGNGKVPSLKTIQRAIMRTVDVYDRHRLIDAAASLNKELDNDWAVAKILHQGNGIEAKRDQIDRLLENFSEIGQVRNVTSSSVEVDLSDIPRDT